MNKGAEMAIDSYPVGWFAPTYKMLSDNWRVVKSMLAPITKDVSVQEKRLQLITGGIIDFWSLDNPDSGRGKKYKRVIINEVGMIRSLRESWNDVIRATLADLEGDAFFGGTPKGMNYFYELYQMADNHGDWARWRFPTSANPYIKASEIEEMRQMMPERTFQQEILAEFVADGSYFQNVDKACTIAEPDKPEQHTGHYLVMGVDWALSEDFTVLTVGCRNCNRVVDWERFNKIDFTYQRERVVGMAKRWSVNGVLPERNSIGVPNIELLIPRVRILSGPDEGLGFNTSATTKPELIQDLASALEHSGFKAPHDYSDELRAYEVEMSTSGHPKFSAPQGLHDDRVISLALCWRAMTMGGGPLPAKQPEQKSKWLENTGQPEEGSRWRQI